MDVDYPLNDRLGQFLAYALLPLLPSWFVQFNLYRADWLLVGNVIATAVILILSPWHHFTLHRRRRRELLASAGLPS